METIKELFKRLAAKKAEVANAERPVYITNGQFRYSEAMGSTIDITTARDARKLVEILGFLYDRKNSYEKAAKELGVETSFTWLGVSVDDWEKDLKTRVSVINIIDRRRELAELEERLNRIVPADLRAQMEVEAITEALK